MPGSRGRGAGIGAASWEKGREPIFWERGGVGWAVGAYPFPGAVGPPPPSGRAGRVGPGGAWAEAPENQPLPSAGPTGFYYYFVGSFDIFILLNFLSRSTIGGKRGPGASVAARGGPRPGGAHLWLGSSRRAEWLG